MPSMYTSVPKVTDSGKTASAGCSAGDISLAESVIMRTDIANPFLRRSRAGNFDSKAPARYTRSNGTMQLLMGSKYLGGLRSRARY